MKKNSINNVAVKYNQNYMEALIFREDYETDLLNQLFLNLI